MKNLHNVFLILGILLGFWMFASIVDGSAAGAFILYLLFYIPAFFGGLFSGESRTDSELAEVWTEMINSVFQLTLDNHICTIWTTFLYFAFWAILSAANDFVSIELSFYILTAFVLGLLSNEDVLSRLTRFLSKYIRLIR